MSPSKTAIALLASIAPCEVQRRDYEGDTIMVLGLAFGGAR